MHWLRYLFFALLIFMASPVYAEDNDSTLYHPEKDGYYERADSAGLSPIILDLAISLYKSERFEQARKQFEIVLTLRPGDKTALKYIALIKKRLGEAEEEVKKEEPKEEEEETTEEAATETADETAEEQDTGELSLASPAKPEPPPKTKETPSIPKVLILDAKTKKPTFTLEIEQNELITITGKTVRRILLTQPDIINLEKDADTLYVTGKNIGKTYLHIWDSQQRWTVEFRTIPKKQKGFGAEDEEKYAEERAKELQIHYALATSYNKIAYKDATIGSDFSSRFYQHILETATPLETPNGNFYFSASVNSRQEESELSYASVRWRNGQIGPLKDINLQAIDFRPERTDLAFSKGDLRGIQVSSPLVENKLRANIFWGEEIGLRFGGFIPPGIEYKKQQVYYSGLNLDYAAGKEQFYSLSAYKAGGRDRTADQRENAYDLKALYNFDKLKLMPEIAFDTETYATKIKIDYGLPAFGVTTELRDISKDFQAVSGKDYQAGQKGVLLDIHYRPYEKISFSNKIDLFQDGLYPNPDLPDRWNKEISFGTLWSPMRLIEAQGDYNYGNYMGKNFPTIIQSTSLGLRFRMPTERRINLYVNYNRNKNLYIRTPILDYLSNKITAGSLFNLVPSVYCFFEKEINRITSLASSESAVPKALQTGVEWSSQVYNTAVYQTLRFTYRDEEDTSSPFSFMIGEDYVEGYGEIAYAPVPYFNFSLNARVRNIRTEATPSVKRVETEILAGLNYLFNTHLRFDPVGTIQGYVYKDLNLDGMKQPDEPAIPGVELRIVSKRIQSTDRSGAYKFMNVKAKKVYISVNPATIPEGFILIGPTIREAVIVNKDITELNFGVSSRTEIHGSVFEDIDGDYKFGLHDKGVKNVALVLEDGTRIYTDAYGAFEKRLPPGKYRIKLDLETVPEEYMPMVPIFSDFELEEGQSMKYDIPLLKFK